MFGGKGIMGKLIGWLRRAHALAHKKTSQDDPNYVKTLKMVAAIIASILAARRLLVGSDDDLIPYDYLIYIAAIVIIAPEAIRFVIFISFLFRYLIFPETVKITGLWEPTTSSLNFYYSNKNKSEYPIGGALEVLSPGNITEIADANGWDPEEISIELVGQHEVSDLLRPLRPTHADGGANRKKYTLSKIQKPFSDSVGKLRIQVEETDFASVSEVSRRLLEDQDLRHSLISCDPSERRVPHSLCLHALCEFEDESVLMMQRHEHAWYYPSAFSASFEEQLDELDFQDGGEFAISHLVSRGICEEIFPMLGKYHRSSRLAWAQVNDFVKSNRIWSVILEEEIGNFALFCHLRIGVDVPSYVDVYRELKKQGGRRDREGKLYALKPEDVVKLLEYDDVSVSEILVDELEDIKVYGERVPVGSLHPTSRYRLLSWATTKRLVR